MHEKIRENPILEKKERTKPAEKKQWKQKKLTYEERKAKLKVLLLALHVLAARLPCLTNPCADAGNGCPQLGLCLVYGLSLPGVEGML